VRLTSKGQLTIPIDIREQLGLLPGTPVDFAVEGDAVKITRAADREGRGERMVRALRGGGDVDLSTDEIMALTRAD
jgi:AbrB family looped-hinge helix DNA binding protein